MSHRATKVHLHCNRPRQWVGAGTSKTEAITCARRVCSSTSTSPKLLGSSPSATLAERPPAVLFRSAFSYIVSAAVCSPWRHVQSRGIGNNDAERQNVRMQCNGGQASRPRFGFCRGSSSQYAYCRYVGVAYLELKLLGVCARDERNLLWCQSPCQLQALLPV